MLRQIFALILSILLVAAAAAFGSSFGVGEWYAQIQKPSWNPPNWIFGPVWTTLYLMMAIAAWLVWRQRHAHKVWPALTLYLVQLVLNALWSMFFFGWHWMGFAAIEIVVLWCFIVLTAIRFWPISPIAALMLLPYIAWVGFASILNITLWRLNT